MTDAFSKQHTTMSDVKKGTTSQHENIILTVDYGRGSILILGCNAVSGPLKLAIMEGKIKSQV